MNFTYSYKSRTLFYKGNTFDSTIELKYALSIENTHAWLRDGIEIYYGLNVQPHGIKVRLHCYKPDFLIRNLTTGHAELIEIKPDGFSMLMQFKRAKIVAKHKKRFAYDWEFRVVTESDIHLSALQRQQLRKIIDTQSNWHHQPCLKLLQNNTTLTDEEYRQFVWVGVSPAVP